MDILQEVSLRATCVLLAYRTEIDNHNIYEIWFYYDPIKQLYALTFIHDLNGFELDIKQVCSVYGDYLYDSIDDLLAKYVADIRRAP